MAGAVSDIVLAVAERRIAPGETACFPFVARTAYGIPSIHEFSVISDNPDFRPEWVRLGRSAGDGYGPRFILEISPGDIGPAKYGAYPLLVVWRAAGAYRPAGGRCTLVIGPRAPAVTEPAGQRNRRRRTVRYEKRRDRSQIRGRETTARSAKFF